MVLNILFAGAGYTIVLVAVSVLALLSSAKADLFGLQQTVVLARSADADINTFPGAYSWLYFVNRMFMSGVAGIAEPFFLWRATKVSAEHCQSEGRANFSNL